MSTSASQLLLTSFNTEQLICEIEIAAGLQPKGSWSIEDFFSQRQLAVVPSSIIDTCSGLDGWLENVQFKCSTRTRNTIHLDAPASTRVLFYFSFSPFFFFSALRSKGLWRKLKCQFDICFFNIPSNLSTIEVSALFDA